MVTFPKRLIVLVLVCMIVLSVPGSVFAAKQDFFLINRSGYNITGFWVVPYDSDSWEENLLEGDVLRHGEKIEIIFDRSDTNRWWNFRIKDSSGREWLWEKEDYDLTKISEIVYIYRGGRGFLEYR